MRQNETQKKHESRITFCLYCLNSPKSFLHNYIHQHPVLLSLRPHQQHDIIGATVMSWLKRQKKKKILTLSPSHSLSSIKASRRYLCKAQMLHINL